ncbi:hypothetical protein RHMOL_Rhmol10G0061900 [Rhododendron molle]|uniref:Uncharacterized protein n=1 Tax=Rhododendron molle TaxID=49168 RepID=A0ACC0LZT4_RHOML|nr:hypothetical protein RHMOL_Rhmol10G0061900 [Rhododendron molle]
METHVLAIPYPAQGHVIPLLELAQCLVHHGFRVTFVNTEFNHKRVMNALSANDNLRNLVKLVSIPDGLEPWEDRNDMGKLTESASEVMPGKLEELIEKINGSDSNKITCVIADACQGWALEVAEKMRIRRAAFRPAAAALWALQLSIPELIADGIIESYGKTFSLTLDLFATTKRTVPNFTTDFKYRTIEKIQWNFCYRMRTISKKIAMVMKSINPTSVAMWLSFASGLWMHACIWDFPAL